MERVTPLRHLGGMESFISFVLTASAVVSGVLLVAVGTFSVITLMLGDLLESDPDPCPADLPEAA